MHMISRKILSKAYGNQKADDDERVWEIGRTRDWRVTFRWQEFEFVCGLKVTFLTPCVLEILGVACCALRRTLNSLTFLCKRNLVCSAIKGSK